MANELFRYAVTTACFLGCARCNTQCVGRRHGRQSILFFISLIHLRTSPQKPLAGRTYSTMTAGPTGSRSIRVQAKGKGKGKGKGSLLQRSTNHSSWQCGQNKFRSRRRNQPGESGSNHNKVPCKTNVSRKRTKGLRPLGDKQLHSKLKQESKRGTISTNIICFYDTVRESCHVWESEKTCKKDLSILNRTEASAEQTAKRH